METVKVIDNRKENKEGWKIINKADMTKDDKLYTDKPAPKKAQKGEQSK